MKNIFFIIIIILIIALVPEKDLMDIKKSIDSWKPIEIFKEGLFSFINFLNKLTGIDFKNLTSNIIQTIHFYLDREILRYLK